MKADRLLDVIGRIEDAYIVSAQNRLGEFREDQTFCRGNSVRRGYRRALLTAAAVFLVLLSSFTAAMAASEEFRNAVFRFFHISGPVRVPDLEESGEDPELIGIAGSMMVENAVEVEYIRVKGSYGHTVSGGAVYVSGGEEEGTVQAYTITEGKLIPLTAHREEFEYTWKDMKYRVDFEWYENDGMVSVGAGEFDPETSAGWQVGPVEGNPQYAVVTLTCGSQTEYGAYPLLYDLKNHRVEDVLEDCREIRDQNILEAEFSPDLSRILITCGENVMWYDEQSRKVYCYDPEKKDCQDLSRLCGMTVMDAWFADEDTVCCVRYDEDFLYTLRVLTLSDGKYFQGFSDMPAADWSEDGRGISFNGSRYGLLITEENICVYDFRTGERIPVEGLQKEGSEYFADLSAGSFNQEGTKLLFSQTGTGEDIWVTRIGILDLEKKTFVSFEREGEGTPREYSISWFDNDRVGIESRTEEDWYLYLFRAEGPDGGAVEPDS